MQPSFLPGYQHHGIGLHPLLAADEAEPFGRGRLDRHAGLECGLFLEKYPKLEMISVGPTLRGVHSPDERLEIATVDKFWKFLIEILRTL